MKNIKTKFLLCSLLVLLSGCSSDDNNNSDDQSGEINQLISEITGGSETIWKIESASLTNASITDLDVSNTFNIVDDEFIFTSEANSQTIELTYKQGNAFNESAASISEFLLNLYKSAEIASLTITDLTNKTFGDINKSFNYNSETNMTAQISISNAILNLELSPKNQADYASPPIGGLNFTEVGSIAQRLPLSLSVGFTGANHNNSLYIAFRENVFSTTVYKYDLNSNGVTENRLDPNGDLTAKRALIVNNQLKIFGGNYVSTYDLDIEDSPTAVRHDLELSRFGLTTIDNDVYFIGGDLNNPADKIRLYDQSTNIPEIIATMPTPKFWVSGEIVDNNIYVFGGQQSSISFTNETAESLSYIYNLEDNSFTSFNLPKALFASYAARYQNLIYVAGNVGIDADDDGDFEDFDNFFGVYNTLDDSFTELTIDDDVSTNSSIVAITIFNNKLYALFDSPIIGAKIMVADL